MLIMNEDNTPSDKETLELIREIIAGERAAGRDPRKIIPLAKDIAQKQDDAGEHDHARWIRHTASVLARELGL